MILKHRGGDDSLVWKVRARVLQTTYGRIRNLEVEEVQGRVEVRGRVPSHHMKQLVFHGALELVSGDRFSSKITVG